MSNTFDQDEWETEVEAWESAYRQVKADLSALEDEAAGWKKDSETLSGLSHAVRNYCLDCCEGLDECTCCARCDRPRCECPVCGDCDERRNECDCERCPDCDELEDDCECDGCEHCGNPPGHCAPCKLCKGPCEVSCTCTTCAKCDKFTCGQPEPPKVPNEKRANWWDDPWKLFCVCDRCPYCRRIGNPWSREDGDACICECSMCGGPAGSCDSTCKCKHCGTPSRGTSDNDGCSACVIGDYFD